MFRLDNIHAAVPVLRLVFLMWLAFALHLSMGIDLGAYGILPRTIEGLKGVLLAPIIHGSLQHLVSNTVPLLILGVVLYGFYYPYANRVFYYSYFMTNILVWVFGRSHYHIGASGLIYAIAAFLAFFGLFQKDFKSLLISTVVIVVYGGMVYGVFPTSPNVSFESHLFGAVSGVLFAYLFSKYNKN